MIEMAIWKIVVLLVIEAVCILTALYWHGKCIFTQRILEGKIDSVFRMAKDDKDGLDEKVKHGITIGEFEIEEMDEKDSKK